MMQLNIVSGFTQFFDGPLSTSIISKAIDKNKCTVELFDLRDYTVDKHKTIDDLPYAGKPGMLLKAEPFFRAMDEIKNRFGDHTVVYCGPEGKQFDQSIAKDFVENECITFLCGHFKGIDQRVLNSFVTEYISIGDFIITGGELSSLVVIDAVIRLIPGVLNDINSAKTDSFEDGLLDCNYYTRPEIYREISVPKVLLNGHHEEIEQWKQSNKIEKTKTMRPDLYQNINR